MSVIMTGRAHPLAAEHRDLFGRVWCSVCRLPNTNAKAQAMHAAAMATTAQRGRYEREDLDDAA